MCVLPAISLFAQSTLAVVEKKAGKVGFYTVEGKRTGEVQTGAFPHETVFSPDRRFLYVTDNGMLWMTDKGEGGNTITIIDVAAVPGASSRPSSLKHSDLSRRRSP